MAQAFSGARSVLLDTGPTVYALEKSPEFGERAKAAIEHLFDRGIEVVSTPVSLAECLAGAPQGDVATYVGFLTQSHEVTFVGIGAATAVVAGELRRTTGLKLPDCMQIASAVEHGCDLFLTNDRDLERRQGAIRTLLIADLEL